MPNSKSFTVAELLGLLFISLLLILHNVVGVDFNRYIFVAILGLLFIMSNKSNIYELLAFITPCISGLPYNHIAIIAITVLLLKNLGKVSRYNVAGIVCIVIIIALEVISMGRGFGGVNELLSFIAIFSLVFMRLIDGDLNVYNNRRICLFFITGYWVAVVCLFGQYIMNGYSIIEMSQMAENSFRIGNTNEFSDAVNGVRTNITFNSNGLGEISIVASLLSLLLNKRSSKPLLLLSFFGALIVGFTTLSRSFVLTALFSLFLYFVFGLQGKNVARNTLFLLVAVFVIYYLLSSVLTSYVLGFGNRMNTGDVANGRVGIFSRYHRILLSNPLILLFGVGIQQYPIKLGEYMSTHNGMQEVVLAWGLLGFLLIVLLIAISLKNAKRYGLISKPGYVPLFALLFASQFGQSVSNPDFLLMLFVTISAVMMENKVEGIQGVALENVD